MSVTFSKTLLLRIQPFHTFDCNSPAFHGAEANSNLVQSKWTLYWTQYQRNRCVLLILPLFLTSCHSNWVLSLYSLTYHRRHAVHMLEASLKKPLKRDSIFLFSEQIRDCRPSDGRRPHLLHSAPQRDPLVTVELRPTTLAIESFLELHSLHYSGALAFTFHLAMNR